MTRKLVWKPGAEEDKRRSHCCGCGDALMVCDGCVADDGEVEVFSCSQQCEEEYERPGPVAPGPSGELLGPYDKTRILLARVVLAMKKPHPSKARAVVETIEHTIAGLQRLGDNAIEPVVQDPELARWVSETISTLTTMLERARALAIGR
jgi:hypothetical protein